MLSGERQLCLSGRQRLCTTQTELPTRQSREARPTPHTRDSRSARVSLKEPESVTPYAHGEGASILVGFLKISIPDTAQKKETEGAPEHTLEKLEHPQRTRLHKKIARAGTCSFLPISQ